MQTRKRYHSKRSHTRKRGGQPPKRIQRHGINAEKAKQKRINESIKKSKGRREAELSARRIKSLKNISNKLKQESNITDMDIKKSYEQCIIFIKLFIKRADRIANSNNTGRKDNYDIFASILKENLIEVNEKYEDIIDNEKFENNNNNLVNPLEYLEKYIKLVKDEKIVDEFNKAVDEYYENPGNNNTKEEYNDLYNFLNDSANAVKETIRKYSGDLKSKKSAAMEEENDSNIAPALVPASAAAMEEENSGRLNTNLNINSLISGFSAVKVNNNPNAVNNMSSIFSRLGL